MSSDVAEAADEAAVEEMEVAFLEAADGFFYETQWCVTEDEAGDTLTLLDVDSGEESEYGPGEWESYTYEGVALPDGSVSDIEVLVIPDDLGIDRILEIYSGEQADEFLEDADGPDDAAA